MFFKLCSPNHASNDSNVTCEGVYFFALRKSYKISLLSQFCQKITCENSEKHLLMVASARFICYKKLWRFIGKRDFWKRLTSNFRYILYLKFGVNVLRSTLFPMEYHKSFSRLLLSYTFDQLRSTQVATIHCNAQTSPLHVLQKLSQTCMTVSTNNGRVYRPKDCERLVLYLKDLNLPKLDKWGTSQLVAFLQQVCY